MPTALRMLLLLAVLTLGAPFTAQADAVCNGNELALNLTRWTGAKRAELVKTRTGMVHTFRCLRITKRSEPDPNTSGITLTTIEPSSDATVIFTANTRISLDLVKSLTTNDAVAVSGRVANISTNVPPVIEIHPAVVQFQDRLQPKLGKELLREVDKTAH